MFKNIFNLGGQYVRKYATEIVQKATAATKERTDISKLVLSNITNSPQKCRLLRENVLNSTKQITVKSVDSIILKVFIADGQYERAKSYIHFMKSENIKFNLATIGKCFKLHHTMFSNQLSTHEDEEGILLMYDNLCKEYPILDSITSEYVILGLSVTKEWRKCFKIFEDIKISCIPNAAAYNAIISAAFSNGEYNTGWNLFQEMIENNRPPFTSTYLSYLQEIRKNENKTKYLKLSDLLHFVACYDLELNNEVAEKISEITCGNSQNTSILRTGVCRICQKKLQRLELSPSEFEQLKKSFTEDVIVGKDIFHNTTPEELAKFINFVKNMGKFDVIVDGLNVAYSAGVKQSPQVHSMLLAGVVRHFHKQGKKVLVIGRTHMQKLPKNNWQYVKQNATVFLTNNISQDDPYTLYCGLHSGINTIIVTRDFMRSHLHLLKDKQNKLLFNRWLRQSRYHLLHVAADNVFFKVPLPYMLTPQRHENHWHVPYTRQTDPSREPTHKWLCIHLH